MTSKAGKEKLIAENDPLPDEEREIAEYEKRKLKNRTTFIGLEEIHKVMRRS
ncbi:MAG: hypothetical protein Q6363_003675 [Candidatus Njordarchaeota archaeon]